MNPTIGDCAETHVSEYLSEIKRNLARGNATEHTHRSALKRLIESAVEGVVATNEPKRVACGAPDFIVTRHGTPLGHVETKDVGTDLGEMQRGKGSHGEQFVRYNDALPNWILTDYLRFRWFVGGKPRLSVDIAEQDTDGKIKPTADGTAKLAEMLTAFFEQETPTVGTAKELAERMARMTRFIRDLIVGTLEHEKEQGWLHNWLNAFRETLIPDLDERRFADMFAQTLAYGLFAARVHAPPGERFSRRLAAFNLPKTNPFLRKLFSEIAGVDMPESIAWAVDDLVDLLRHADMAEILTDFGRGKGKEDPVVHFYETFLTAYDPRMRELRGVYYTPEPVVGYIVRSIDHLLKTRFGRPKGLADENTLILDPAAGTGTFLYSVIEEIHRKFARQAGAWDDYVAKSLLNRLFGFELLMAPYAVAHLKLGMQLRETGYKFATDQRLGIYLTNTLEEAAKKSEHLFAGWVAEEANAAARIKRDDPILVVLGNPPYSGVSANRGKWITNLVADYRKVDGKPLGEKKVWLKNDYIKFIRFGQWRIQHTGHGILAFITDHSYLDSPTFRGMRQNLMETFDEIYVLNLHGNSKRREIAPDGEPDENVFDITQGTAIVLFVKHDKKGEGGVFYADLWGKRKDKYEALNVSDVRETKWRKLSPAAPFHQLVHVKRRSHKEYEKCWRFTDIFPVGSNGVQTSRDKLVVSKDHAELVQRFEWIRNVNTEGADVKRKLAVEDRVFWKLAVAREELRKDRKWKNQLQRYLYRPFDQQWLFASASFVHRLRWDVMRHLEQPNIAICIGRAGLVTHGSWNLVFCARNILDHNLFYRGSSLNCPLYLYPNGKMPATLFDHENGRRPNLSSRFVDELCERLGLGFVPDGRGDLRKTLGPEDIFHYAYAVLHSPTYRKRYAEFLKIDFPRLPLVGDLKLFRALAAKGAELAALHLMESPKLDKLVTEFPQKGDNVVDKVRYTDADRRVWINRTQYFQGVPKECWEYHVGGYQVCHKWLKDRKGRELGYEEIEHYQKIVVALRETIRLMLEVDECVPAWPLT